VERGEAPNLASQVLGAAIRALPDQWQKTFAYTPLLAETFTDIESFHGTCYKAAGWIPVGISRGYSRHHVGFFTANGEPKKIWLKELRPQAITLLCGEKLPPECDAGAHSNAQGVMPLKVKQIDSLIDALRRVPDPRKRNRSFKLYSVLSIVVMAQLSGKIQLSEIHRFGQRLSQKQRRAIGLPLKNGSKLRRIPSYSVYWKVLNMLCPDLLARVLNTWLSQENGPLPGRLAFDGKMVRDTAGVLSLVDAETGVVRAMIPMRHKEEGKDGELTRAQELIEQLPDLNGQLLSGDALHAQKKSAKILVEKGGDYLLQLKDNQPTLRAFAEKKVQGVSPFLKK
jgi:hypothetical protein